MERDQAYIFDMLDSAKQALLYISESDLEGFHHDTKLQDAVIRRLEIIGEAARRASTTLKLKHPNLPWGEMIGLRNIMIHEYDDIDLDVVWTTLKTDIPDLIRHLEAILDY